MDSSPSETFTASRWTKGNFFFPTKLVVSPQRVIRIKSRMFGSNEAQLEAVHNSPDGRLPGREILLAMYVHVAHHRGQAEIYLRDKGIKPPSYRI